MAPLDPRARKSGQLADVRIRGQDLGQVEGVAGHRAEAAGLGADRQVRLCQQLADSLWGAWKARAWACKAWACRERGKQGHLGMTQQLLVLWLQKLGRSGGHHPADMHHNTQQGNNTARQQFSHENCTTQGTFSLSFYCQAHDSAHVHMCICRSTSTGMGIGGAPTHDTPSASLVRMPPCGLNVECCVHSGNE
eukprot:365084-Chlamydomonas_euryale.AAC.18